MPSATDYLQTLPTSGLWGMAIRERTRSEAAIMLAKLDAVEAMTDNSTVLQHAKRVRAKVMHWLDGDCLGYMQDYAAWVDSLVTDARWYGRNRKSSFAAVKAAAERARAAATDKVAA